jgi:ubiquinone/menaquinone biosynthesis C-methylase UbiE
MRMHRNKPYRGIGMEGRIAAWYAKSTRRDIDEFRRLADRLSKETSPHSRILEVAPGPGYLSIELAKLGQFEIVGLDISQSFIEIARENARTESVNIEFRHGNASAMPFAENSFDLVVCRAAFKNFSEPVDALNEMFRTLKVGGRAVILDLRKDASFKEVAGYVEELKLGWLDSVITKLIFVVLLIPRAYSKDQFAHMASVSRFGGCSITEAGIGLEVLLVKRF